MAAAIAQIEVWQEEFAHLAVSRSLLHSQPGQNAALGAIEDAATATSLGRNPQLAGYCMADSQKRTLPHGKSGWALPA